METLLELPIELPPELVDLPDTPEFRDFWAHCPFRWQGDHGAVTWLDNLYNWDRVALAPRPTLTMITPNSGTPPITIDVLGSNFVSGAKVFFAGYELPSVTFISQGRLTVPIPVGYAGLAPAAYFVMVVNPDNQASSTQSFTIPAP